MRIETFQQYTYIIAAGCFILSLKWLSRPTTARRGVTIGEIGMGLAIIGALITRGMTYNWIIVGLVPPLTRGWTRDGLQCTAVAVGHGPTSSVCVAASLPACSPVDAVARANSAATVAILRIEALVLSTTMFHHDYT